MKLLEFEEGTCPSPIAGDAGAFLCYISGRDSTTDRQTDREREKDIDVSSVSENIIEKAVWNVFAQTVDI